MQTNCIKKVTLMIFLGLLTSAAFAAEDAHFQSAKPIWPKGREKEMNLTVGFRAVVEKPGDGKAILRLAASTIYRAWINGEFLGCGPARGPHDYYRVDRWDLTEKLQPGKNLIAIEVAGYNVNSYSLLDQPSFLQAEIVAGDRVLASTGAEGAAFSARVLDSRVQKVQRYSFQRPFSEVYRFTPESDRWRRDVMANESDVETAALSEKNLLPRRVRYPDFALMRPIEILSAGRVEPIKNPPKPWKDRSMTQIGPTLKGYRESELSVVPFVEAQTFRSVETAALHRPYTADEAIPLAAGEYRILDLGVNRTGFLGATVTCSKKTRLWLLFDEILSGKDGDFKRLGCVNLVGYELAPGTYQIETIEPYTLRYLKALCLDGPCEVRNVYLREFAHPQVTATFKSSDERINRVFAAGVETFRQNALDIFMDCPSRERAGWLCDSFFTSRVALDLDGDTLVEKNFVENFLLPKKFPFLPDGMLPMCYPADHNDGVYIPNWALWFALELEEYGHRSGDRATVDALRPKILKLLDFFKKYENQDGLLEKLPSWVFVEWSEAAKFVQDVNYPSNMLYAGTLSAVARMYDMPDLAAKADRIREAIRRQSFDGRFFVDNAVRDKDGKLKVTRNRTEVCQYYAFFFQIATSESHPELWGVLRDQFGPDRQKNKGYPEIHPANSFVGNMLRIELLSQAGRSRQILDESIAYLLYMADRTGTLWENTTPSASCDHGFASHIVHTLYRDILGIRQIDRQKRTIAIQFDDLPLEYCEGTLPTEDGPIYLHWTKTGDEIEYVLKVPDGYKTTISNRSRKRLLAK
jgi:alpha-L-rhamnosidase